MAALQIFDEFFGNLATGVHGNMNTSATTRYKIRLSATAPDKAAMTNISAVAAVTGGSYVDQTITLSWAETATPGVWQFGTGSSDCVFTPSGGNYSGFRYAYLYDTSASNALIAVLDYGTTVNLTSGNPFTIDAGSNGWIRFTTPAWV